MGIANRGALFEKSVNAQGKKSPYFRLLFAVAKMDNAPYCGEALRNESLLGNINSIPVLESEKVIVSHTI